MLWKQRIVRDRWRLGPYSKYMSMVEATSRAKRSITVRHVVGTAIVTLSAVFIVKALKFFSFEPEALGKYFRFKWVLMGHIAGGALALVTGPFQLSKAFRNANRRAHRMMGRIYAGGVSAGALCALFLASTTARVASGSYVFSLLMLASVWLTSTLFAWHTAVHKRFKQHEEWANRSYIATVAFRPSKPFVRAPLRVAPRPVHRGGAHIDLALVDGPHVRL